MRLIVYLLFSIPLFTFAQPLNSWDHEKLEVNNGEELHVIMDADAIFKDRWDILPQPQFWKEIMLLSPDSCLINVAATRVILNRMTIHAWKVQSESEKELFRDSLRQKHNLSASETIYVTTGKNDFYRFDAVYPSLSKGVETFESIGVDPWYAQAILLIESPGQLKKSRSGAYGAFQLMPGVARANGLIVNRYVDERADFEKSAIGSARLIDRVCIPEAKKILEAHAIPFNESDLWFRLFVLHVYHAGSSNVSAVVNKIDPEQGGQNLIAQMWQNTAAHFGNNSQNYTQLALASQLILNDMIYSDCEFIYNCDTAQLD
jgi:hypothetical protein